MKEKLIEELLEILSKESEVQIPNVKTIDEKRILLNYIMLSRRVDSIDDYILELQDKILQSENKNPIKIDANKIKFKHIFAEIYENSINFESDLLVCFTDKLFSNDINLSVLDNQIALISGMQYVNEMYKKFTADGNLIDYLNPYISNGFNFNSKIAKIIVKNDNLDLLKNNILSLFNYIEKNNLKIITIRFSEYLNVELIEKIKKILKNSLKIAKNKSKFIILLKK